MSINEHIMRIIKKTNYETSWFLRMIKIKFWRRLYPLKLILITMKLLMRSQSRDFHEYYENLSESQQKPHQKGSWSNINRRVQKESTTDMESSIFKTLKTAQDLGNIIWFDVVKSTKRDFSTRMLVTPPDSPFRAAQCQPWRRVLRTCSIHAKHGRVRSTLHYKVVKTAEICHLRIITSIKKYET